VHREIRASAVVRRVYDFLAQTLPPVLAQAEAPTAVTRSRGRHSSSLL
jgi:hypothetical protein